MELTARQQAALMALVTDFLVSGEPVGSVRLRDLLGGGCSSATLRNDLMELCEVGLLEQPHVSAGRSPTDRGLRYFVDHLPVAGPQPEQERWLDDLVHRYEGSLGVFLEALSDGLARMSGMLVVAAVQTTQAAPLEHIDISYVNPHEVVLVIAVGGGAEPLRAAAAGRAGGRGAGAAGVGTAAGEADRHDAGVVDAGGGGGAD